jgi:dynein intermediate chain 1
MNNEQEQLTNEQKEELVYKSLTSNNPQAPHNLVQFSYKDRVFKTDQYVDHMVFHVNMDGNIIQEESLEYEDQK